MTTTADAHHAAAHAVMVDGRRHDVRRSSWTTDAYHTAAHAAAAHAVMDDDDAWRSATTGAL
jgi:hypothetical protein